MGKKPIAVHQAPLSESAKKSLGGAEVRATFSSIIRDGAKFLVQLYTFFLKAHILAGQARPNGTNVTDFAWLTKEEIEPRVDQAYWASVKDILSDF